MSRLEDHDTCYCGHVLDEHREGRECLIDDCGCVHFEKDESGEDSAE